MKTITDNIDKCVMYLYKPMYNRVFILNVILSIKKKMLDFCFNSVHFQKTVYFNAFKFPIPSCKIIRMI